MAGIQIASLFAKISADTSALNKALIASERALEQTAGKMRDVGDKAAPQMAKGFGEATKDIAKMFVVPLATVTAFGVAAKKAFDFSEQGAAIIQTATSFDRLGVSIETMREASRGTISDMGLMSSTLMLIAGASEELQGHMLENAPQLMEIAKAANAVNPALGTTAFMYDSISRGIKRSSPLILDNLGIIVKIGAANEQYATAIGKTVEQLSAEDKQIALLNATLEAGSRLIEQAGGDVASYGDAWAAFRTEFTNVTDDMKAQGAEGVEPLIGRWAELLRSVRENDEALIGIGTTFRFFNEVILGVQDTVGKFTYGELLALEKGMRYVNTGFRDMSGAAPAAAAGVLSSAEALKQYNAAIDANDAANLATMIAQMWEVSEAGAAAASANLAFAASIGEMSEAQFVAAQLELLAEALGDDADASWDLVEAQRALLVEFGLLTPAEEKAAQVMGDLAQKLKDDVIDLDTYAAALANIKAYMDSLESKEIDLTINTHFNTFGDPAAAGGAGGYVDPGTGSAFTNISSAQGFSGMVSSPTRFTVAEGGEPEFVSVVPRSKMQSGGYGMGGVGSTWTGDLIIQGTGDPESTANAVMRKLADRGMIPASGALR